MGLDIVHRIMQARVDIIELDQRLGPLLMTPKAYHNLLQDFLKANQSIGTRRVEDFIGVPVIVVQELPTPAGYAWSVLPKGPF